jgi:hypothetical protein
MERKPGLGPVRLDLFGGLQELETSTSKSNQNQVLN